MIGVLQDIDCGGKCDKCTAWKGCVKVAPLTGDDEESGNPEEENDANCEGDLTCNVGVCEGGGHNGKICHQEGTGGCPAPAPSDPMEDGNPIFGRLLSGDDSGDGPGPAPGPSGDGDGSGDGSGSDEQSCYADDTCQDSDPPTCTFNKYNGICVGADTNVFNNAGCMFDPTGTETTPCGTICVGGIDDGKTCANDGVCGGDGSCGPPEESHFPLDLTDTSSDPVKVTSMCVKMCAFSVCKPSDPDNPNNPEIPCFTDDHCPGTKCATGECVGGTKDGDDCSENSDCPGGGKCPSNVYRYYFAAFSVQPACSYRCVVLLQFHDMTGYGPGKCSTNSGQDPGSNGSKCSQPTHCFLSNGKICAGGEKVGEPCEKDAECGDSATCVVGGASCAVADGATPTTPCTQANKEAVCGSKDAVCTQFRNNLETDVNCGGKCGPSCDEGKNCKVSSDCKDGFFCDTSDAAKSGMTGPNPHGKCTTGLAVTVAPTASPTACPTVVVVEDFIFNAVDDPYEVKGYCSIATWNQCKQHTECGLVCGTGAAEAPGRTCTITAGTCTGGSAAGEACTSNDDCAGGGNCSATDDCAGDGLHCQAQTCEQASRDKNDFFGFQFQFDGPDGFTVGTKWIVTVTKEDKPTQAVGTAKKGANWQSVTAIEHVLGLRFGICTCSNDNHCKLGQDNIGDGTCSADSTCSGGYCQVTNDCAGGQKCQLYDDAAVAIGFPSVRANQDKDNPAAPWYTTPPGRGRKSDTSFVFTMEAGGAATALTVADIAPGRSETFSTDDMEYAAVECQPHEILVRTAEDSESDANSFGLAHGVSVVFPARAAVPCTCHTGKGAAPTCVGGDNDGVACASHDECAGVEAGCVGGNTCNSHADCDPVYRAAGEIPQGQTGYGNCNGVKSATAGAAETCPDGATCTCARCAKAPECLAGFGICEDGNCKAVEDNKGSDIEMLGFETNTKWTFTAPGDGLKLPPDDGALAFANKDEVAMTTTYPIDAQNVELKWPKQFGWAEGTRWEFGVKNRIACFGADGQLASGAGSQDSQANCESDKECDGGNRDRQTCTTDNECGNLSNGCFSKNNWLFQYTQLTPLNKNINVDHEGTVQDLECSGTELSATTPIALSNGVSVTFEEISGFTAGDKWAIKVPKNTEDASTATVTATVGGVTSTPVSDCANEHEYYDQGLNELFKRMRQAETEEVFAAVPLTCPAPSPTVCSGGASEKAAALAGTKCASNAECGDGATCEPLGSCVAGPGNPGKCCYDETTGKPYPQYVTGDYRCGCRWTDPDGLMPLYNEDGNALMKEGFGDQVRGYFQQLIQTTAMNSEVVILDISKGPDTLKSVLQFMESHSWIDKATQRIEVTVPVYNLQLDVFVQANVQFYFTRGGRVDTSLDTEVVQVPSYDGGGAMFRAFLEAAVVFLAGVYAVVEAGEMLSAIRKRGLFGGIGAYLKETQNIFDWALSLIIFVSASYWVQLFNYADGVSVTDSIAMFDGDKYGESLDKITDITVMAALGSQYRLYSGIGLLLLYARCIKIFSFHPKLNIIGRMLSVAAGNIGYFGIVFIFLYLGFAYMGHVAFGHTAETFQSDANAMHTLFMARRRVRCVHY